jgi:hypothetical protein
MANTVFIVYIENIGRSLQSFRRIVLQHRVAETP